MELTKVRLQIAGSNYVISTTDSESYVHELAERLDKDMKDILESAPSASVSLLQPAAVPMPYTWGLAILMRGAQPTAFSVSSWPRRCAFVMPGVCGYMVR